MAYRKSNIVKYDWISIFLFIALVAIGWINIYSASIEPEQTQFWDFSTNYTKQLAWIGLSFPIIVFILAIDSKFYEKYSSLIYIFVLLLLVGLFPFGKQIAGQRAWYSFASFSIQPAEFAKFATALALAKFGSDMNTNLSDFKDQLKAFAIILIPSVLILLQPDPGMAMLYAAFIFPLYREGLHFIYLFLGLFAAAIFVSTLVFGSIWVILISLLVIGSSFYFQRHKKNQLPRHLVLFISTIVLSLSVNHIFHNVFKQHHRDRFNIVLGHEIDNKGIGYNTNQSEIAIGSGGFKGKGWLQGTQTKGRFVPEQHTDYIFSTIGEEWGFLGAGLVVILFAALIIRIVWIGERQKTQFKRMYAYAVASILFFHFSVNIGMVIGIFPTVGIPLPFISYGGSSLWGFSILIFILIRLDAQRLEVN